MNLPRLNQALILEAPERVSDGAGGYTQGWIVVGSVWPRSPHAPGVRPRQAACRSAV
jgi:head-tail adaptor